ncbi:MAG: aminotransferase class V-fold PLP-dependent enzyme [Ruminococcaceae bacterium]|nr:aminotransferase class V-fold PLP-dependent enzyme [Oscillospiraceae bacterium]
MEKIIYFDHAATSWPKPQSVFNSISYALRERGGNPGRSGHKLSVNAARAIYECREAVCRLFSFDSPERVIFTQNTTYALNMAVKGLCRRGDHVLISNFEHNSVLRPLYSLLAYGVEYSMFEASDENEEETIFCFKRAIKSNTKVAVVTAASNVCGKIMPIEKIAMICKTNNIKLIIDGAQAGGVYPFDFNRTGADVICLAGHKGLYGPQGTGIMICSHSCEPESIIEGGNGMMSEDRTMGNFLPEKLEAGTLNTPGICGLRAGIEYVISQTPERIFGTTLLLTDYATEGLSVIDGVRLYGTYSVKAPIILFNKIGYSPSELATYLSERGICVRSGLHCAPTAHAALGSAPEGAVRISFGHNNTKNEIDRFLSAVNRA